MNKKVMSLILIFLSIGNSYDFYRYTLQEELNFSPCSAAAALHPPISGDTIFQGSGITTLSIQSTMITGWFLLKGYTQMYYPLLTITDSNNLIFLLKYRIQPGSFFYTFKTTSQTIASPSLIKNQWYFVKLQLSLGQIAFQYDEINLNIFTSPNSASIVSHFNNLPISTITSFLRNSLKIEIGTHLEQLTQPSCSYSKNVNIYLSPQPWIDSSINNYHHKYSSKTFLFQNLDTINFIALYQIQLIVGFQDYYFLTQTNPLNPRYLPATKIQPFYQTNLMDSNGIIIYYEFFTPSTSSLFHTFYFIFDNLSGSISLLSISSVYQFCIAISINNYCTNQQVLLQKWYQVVAIVDLLIFSIDLIVSGINGLSSAHFQATSAFGVWLYLQAGPNLSDSQYDNIRIYLGALILSSNNCYIQVGNESLDCLICQPGYFLSYQNSIHCIPSSSGGDSDKSNILDWNIKPSCPIFQFYSTTSQSCACMKSFYLINGVCGLCPTYCDECTGPTSCINPDPNRNNILGTCVNDTFDEGQNCIPSNYVIPYKTNLVSFLRQINMATFFEYQYFRNDLGWNSGKSFLLSFSVSLDQSSNSDYSQVISYAREGIQEVFIIVNQFTYTSQLHEICFYFYSTVISCFSVEPAWVWIGLWTDFYQVTTAIQNLANSMQKTSQIQGLNPFIDPVYCLGTCISSLISTSLFQGSLCDSLIFAKGKENLYSLQILLNVLFQLDVTDPKLEIKDFFLLRENSVQTIFEFNSQNVIHSLPYLTGINFAANYPMNLGQSLSIASSSIHLLKGFLYLKGQPGQNIYFGKELSISFNLIAYYLYNPSQPFISFYTKGFLISYSMVAYGFFKQQFTILICVNQCFLAKKCKLEQNSPHFIMIIMRDIEPNYPDITTYEFQVICDFSKDIIQFQNFNPSTSYDKINIQIQKNDSQFQDYHINNLRGYLGSDFYFDYSNKSNCFIYYNLANMKCIKVKQGNSVYQGEVVIPSDCIKFSTPTQAVIYNKYTMECLKINTIIPGCINYSEDLGTCLECLDSHTLISINDCMTCELGYFKSTISGKCEECHPKCSSCDAYDKCTQCKYNSAVMPNCGCALPFHQDPITFQCQTCQPQCETCSNYSNQCITCTNPNLTPPTCQCDPKYFDITKSTDTTCIPITCSYQCSTCENESTNCLSCSINRNDSPNCYCKSAYFEVNEKCVSCKSHQFYDKTTNKCQECNIYCKECSNSSTQCTECTHNQLILKDSNCLCSDQSSYFLTQNGDIKCQSVMEVNLELLVENFHYFLAFTFDEPLDQIDFDTYPINSLIYIFFSNIPPESFEIEGNTIEDKTLKLEIKFTQTFSTTTGSTLFLINKLFTSSKAEKVLNIKYSKVPLKFKIDNILISSKVWTPNKYLFEIYSTIKSSPQFLLYLFRQYQMIFLFLNTLQPCVIFLMTKLTIPPNLYQFLQVIGLLIFPRVPDYSTIPNNKDFNLFGFNLKDDVSSNSSNMFNKFGYSNSMLADIPLAILTQILWSFLLLILFIHQNINISSQISSNLQKVISFLKNKINSNLETSLLIISTCIFKQFLNFKEGESLNRQSFYLAIILLALIVYININNYKSLSFNENADPQSSLNLVEKLDYEKRPQIIRIYYFLQVFKKYMISALLVFLETYPSILCYTFTLFFASSTILTIYIKPYKPTIRNLIKIVGDACLTFAWIIFSIKFVPFQDNFKEQAIIQPKDVEEFLFYGEAVMIILFCFNFLYILDYLIFEISLKIWNFVTTRQAHLKRKQKNKYENELLNQQIVTLTFQIQKPMIIRTNFKKRQQRRNNISNEMQIDVKSDNSLQDQSKQSYKNEMKIQIYDSSNQIEIDIQSSDKQSNISGKDKEN